MTSPGDPPSPLGRGVADEGSGTAAPHGSSSTLDSRLSTLLAADDPTSIDRTAETLAAGGVVAIPTDTVYGIAAALDSPAALARVFEVKGRDPRKVLPVLVSGPDQVAGLTDGLDPDVPHLLAAYWPGPLTVVVPARPGLPAEVTAPDGTVGLRMPASRPALAVVGRLGGALACTSANLSGDPPARTAADALAALGDRLDLVLDGGPTPGGTPSTVIRAAAGRITLLRDGAIPIAHVRRTWRELRAPR